MRVTVLLLLTAWSLLDGHVASQKACERGWFGSLCQYKCRCRNDNCAPQGDCPAGVSCQGGWFGPACQYADLANGARTSHPKVTDGNDSSCLTLPGYENVVITLNDSSHFTWLRVRVSNPDLIYSITVHFRNDTSLSCTNSRTARVDNTSLDIHCDLNQTVDHVYLSGTAIQNLCSVNISGGRNVALKQPATQSSVYSENSKNTQFINQMFDAPKAVDGNRDGWFDKGLTCTHTDPRLPDPNLNVTFSRLHYITRYVLYNRNSNQKRLQHFELRSFSNDSGPPVLHYKDNSTSPQLVYTVTAQSVDTPIRLVDIRTNKTETILTLCELEVYGDSICDERHYGRECEHTCNCDGGQPCFVSTGGCPSGCASGYHGEDCSILITTPATITFDPITNTTEASKTVRQDFECHLNYMHVFIPVELVPNSQLTLRELNCRLLNNGTHHKISFDYDECGTSQSFFEDYISIDNEVNVHNILNNTAEITFVEDYTIPLKCLVDRSKHVNGAIQVISRESIHENAVQSTDFHMKEFTTKDYDLEITAYPIQLPINREIFFEVALTNSSSNSTGIFVEKCEATPSIHRNGTVRVSLINFGCSVNPAVKVLPVPEIDRFRFSIQAFHFSGPENVDNMVYVHCSASTCGGVMCDNTCPKSSRRRRRSTRGQASATLTSGSHVVG